MTDPRVRKIVVDPRDSAVLYAGTVSGVSRSLDAGASWTQYGSSRPSYSLINGLGLDPADPSVLYAATRDEVYSKTQTGDWAPLETIGPRPQFYVNDMALISNSPTSVLLATERDAILKYVPPYALNFAQFADGEGQLSSEILLLNPIGDATARTRSFLRGDNGLSLRVDIAGQMTQGEVLTEVPASGLRVLDTDGEGSLAVGSVRILSDQPLGGVILFGGVVGLAGVGDSPPMPNGFTAPVETDSAAGTNTGVALMNLENAQTTVNCELLGPDGATLATARVDPPLPEYGHRALYVNQFDWEPEVDFTRFQGLLRVTASGLITSTAIQTRPNEFVTMPVVLNPPDWAQPAGLSQPNQGGDSTLYFAQFADGLEALFSQIMLFNLDESASAFGQINLNGDDGSPLTVDLNGVVVSGQPPVSVPPSGLQVFSTDGSGQLAVGSVRIQSDRDLSGVILFGGSVGFAGVGASQALAQGFVAPMEFNRENGVNTGVAMMNLEDDGIEVEFRLTGLNGSQLATARLDPPLASGGHRSLNVNEIDWTPSVEFSDFRGILQVIPTGELSATVIQTRSGQFATMPVVPRTNSEGANSSPSGS